MTSPQAVTRPDVTQGARRIQEASVDKLEVELIG
jgi:hypothetical protein